MIYRLGKEVGKKGLFTAAPPYDFTSEVTSLGQNPEERKLSGTWKSAIQISDEDAPAFTGELAVPWKEILDAGLPKESLILSVTSKGPLAAAPSKGGRYGRLNLSGGKKITSRPFTVKLHFAELDDVQPGTRVFDVLLQGKTVLKNFGVVKEAGGKNRALIKVFKNIEGARTLDLELIPHSKLLTEKTAPIISGIEVIEAQ